MKTIQEITEKVGVAFTELLKNKIGVDYPVIAEYDSRNKRITLNGKAITGNSLGIMKFGIKDVFFGSFGGGSLKMDENGVLNKGEDLIWFNLHYSYNHGAEHKQSTCSNGCAVYLPNEKTSNIWYSIKDEKFYTDSEVEYEKN